MRPYHPKELQRLSGFPSPPTPVHFLQKPPRPYLPNAAVTSSVSKYSVTSCTLPSAMR